MFDLIAFGEKLKTIRKEKNLTQDEVAEKIGISGQAVSKWEKGECLPDVYNLKYLGRLYRISVDDLLATEGDGDEKVIETITIGEAAFEIIEKPETILAGRMIYAKNYTDINAFHAAIGNIAVPYHDVIECKLPVTDIHVSMNFWREERARGFGCVRETMTAYQPEGVDVYKMPASLYIRAYTNRHTAMLVSKEQCGIWELFSYIRNYFIPAHGFAMAGNGAQELEMFDTAEHTTGYAYIPVIRI